MTMTANGKEIVARVIADAEMDYILYSAGWDAHQAELLYYKAFAVDDNGNEYTVFWEITDEYKQLLNDDPEYAANNQDLACDWDDYKVYSDVSCIDVGFDGDLVVYGEQVKNVVIVL